MAAAAANAAAAAPLGMSTRFRKSYRYRTLVDPPVVARLDLRFIRAI